MNRCVNLHGKSGALVQGCLLSIGLKYVLVNLGTDVVFRWVNPRMRG
jgi:peptide/nickel transport system permease protein